MRPDTNYHDRKDPWAEIAEYRDLLEEIVETDGPFAPEARELLAAVNEREEHLKE